VFSGTYLDRLKNAQNKWTVFLGDYTTRHLQDRYYASLRKETSIKGSTFSIAVCKIIPMNFYSNKFSFIFLGKKI
jgi:hypothetical protein